MAIWEYKVVELSEFQSTSTNEEILNAFGQGGWELVAVTATETTASPIENSLAYLKRRKE